MFFFFQGENTVSVTIFHLSLDADNPVINDDKVQRLYVEYHFLGLSAEETETPFSLPKTKAYSNLVFNFKKSESIQCVSLAHHHTHEWNHIHKYPSQFLHFDWLRGHHAVVFKPQPEMFKHGRDTQACTCSYWSRATAGTPVPHMRSFYQRALPFHSLRGGLLKEIIEQLWLFAFCSFWTKTFSWPKRYLWMGIKMCLAGMQMDAARVIIATRLQPMLNRVVYKTSQAHVYSLIS